MASWSTSYALMLVGVTALWGALMNQINSSPIYWLMGPYTAAVSTLVLVVRGHPLRHALRPTRQSVLVGIGFGVVMTAATYPLFHVAESIVPSLTPRVAQLYVRAHDETAPVALAWAMVILTGEELLFRGAWYEALCGRIGSVNAGILSVVIYAGTQLCSGSAVLSLLAAVCGVVWTLERQLTKSLLAPLLTHAIWTPVVLVLAPVTST